MAVIEARQITEARSTSESDKDIAEMINTIYSVAETELLLPGIFRTSEAEISKHISAGEMFGAYNNDKFIGCIKLEELRPGVAGLGPLAVLPEHRGSGVGRILMNFAEDWSRERGFKFAELGVFIPRYRENLSKRSLMEWYTKAGFCQVRVEPAEDAYPRLRSLFATETDHVVYEKRLA